MGRVRRWLGGVGSAVRHRDGSALLVRAHSATGTLAFARLAREMARHPDGRRILDERPRIALTTFDPDELADLAPETLGHRFGAYMRDNGFIREIHIPEGPFPETDATRYARTRWIETHDFRHVLTGLGAGFADETVIAAFQLGMLFNGWSLVVCGVGAIAGAREASPLRTWARLPEAWRAGREARALAFARFEELVGEDVDVLRARFGVRDLSHLSTRS